MNVEVTIFTPTYNRAYIIGQLYESLKRQTVKKFEWLIIDDGSMDETEEVFTRWIKEENEFAIRYYKQENGGKCRAINKALDFANGKLFLVVDSDDILTDDALEKICKWESKLPKDKYCAVSGNLGTSVDCTPNTQLNTEYFDGTALNRYDVIDGERAIAFYTSIHRKYKYPEFEGEKFITEAVTWNRMAADGYKIRFFNDIICVYEYQEDGLTKAGNSVFLNNPKGYGLWIREKAEYEGVSLTGKLKMYYTFTCDMLNRYNTSVIAEAIGTSRVIIIFMKILHQMRGLLRKRV